MVFRRIETNGLDFSAENGFRYALRSHFGLLNPLRNQKCQVASYFFFFFFRLIF